MSVLTITIISEVVEVMGQIVGFVAMRWLVEISTPREDWLYIKNLAIWDRVRAARWYRGQEAYHQIRGAFLLEGL